MMDLRKILIIFIIGILFAVFVHSLIEAIHPSPDYSDYCVDERSPKRVALPEERSECSEFIGPTEAEQDDCDKNKGFIDYTYDENSCPSKWKCNTCQTELKDARTYHNLIVFIISAIFGLIAIAIGLYLPSSKELNQWVSTGFMLGGLITIFIGTIRYFSDMGRFIRPLVMLIELIIVIYISYKKIKE